jgi:hypothetical protein
MIFNIELPFSLNKTRFRNRIRIWIRAYDVRIRIRIQEAKKTRISLQIFFLYWYFMPLFVKLRFSRKVFSKNWRNFAKTVTTFVKVFVFAKGQNSVFVPTLEISDFFQGFGRYLQYRYRYRFLNFEALATAMLGCVAVCFRSGLDPHSLAAWIRILEV